jgi:pSer/pThr/pTyr-binding forkhead associated (FHA) protein
MAKFSVSYKNKVIKTYELKDDVITIGRLPENKICISNMGISRRHSKIERDANNNLVLMDLNSLNGTLVNNKKTPKTILSPGDTITIGKYTIVFESDDKNEPSGAPLTASEAKPSAPEETSELVPVEQPSEATATPLSKETPERPNAPGAGAVLIETSKHIVYKLDKKLITLGSAEGSDIFVTGFLVSEGRIEIERIGNEIHIRSNKFTGKFRVNGKKNKSHVLQHKDRIEIGSSVFRYMES